MNEPHSPEDALANASRDEILSALFANMVVQHTNMALIFLGRAPHPDTGEHVLDLETAKMFIEQLEMLEAKTRGNLNKQEEGLLKKGLAATRMAFVEGVEHAKKPRPGAQRGPAPAAPPPAPAAAGAPDGPKPATEISAAPDTESRKKFTKKY